MPLRSVLAIDVDDDAFQRFSALFTKYQQAVGKLPGAWGNVNQATSAGVGHFQSMAAALMAQAELLRKTNTEAERLNRTVSGVGRGFSGLARDTRDVARNILSATESLLKWTGITGAIGGLLGAGGLFGIERLAQSASGLRRSSQGLGVTSAEQQAFGINYGRIVEPRGFLSSVNEALNDVTKRSSLYGAGLGENQLRGKDAAQVAVALLPQLKRIVDQTPEGLLQQTLQSRGLNQFISLEEAQRLRRTPAGELQGFERGYQNDRRTLSLDDNMLRRWQDFGVQLDRAGTTLKNTFIEGLVGLTEPLTRLSTTFTTAVAAFLKSDEVKEGLDRFATYIGTEEFQSDVKNFVSGVGQLAVAITKAINWIASSDAGVKAGIIGGAFAGGAIGGAVGSLPGAVVGGIVGGVAGGLGAVGPQQGKTFHFAIPPLGTATSPWATAPSQGTRAAPNDAFFNWGSLRQNGAGFRRYESAQEGVLAVSDLLAKYGASGQNTLSSIISKWAPPGENDTSGLIARASRMMGIKPDALIDLYDPEMRRRLVSTMIANEHEGVLPPGLSQGAIDKALSSTSVKPLSAFADRAGAYGVPGAVMNYGGTGALGPAGSNLIQISTPNGRKFTVNRAAAPAFEGFVRELAASGYDIGSIGGYNYREKTGGGSLSEHAFGTAIDINPSRNAYGSTKTDLPAGIHDMAAKYGLVWGGDWKSNPDPMHFQWGGPKAGQGMTAAVRVEVHNQTGGSAVVSGNQVAQ